MTIRQSGDPVHNVLDAKQPSVTFVSFVSVNACRQSRLDGIRLVQTDLRDGRANQLLLTEVAVRTDPDRSGSTCLLDLLPEPARAPNALPACAARGTPSALIATHHSSATDSPICHSTA
jgi:hypothetical protein